MKFRAAAKVFESYATIDQTLVKSIFHQALKDPRKFYNLLILAGYTSIEAQRALYNLRYSQLRTSDPKIRAEITNMLKNIIDLLTKDRMLYSRMRSLAMHGSLGKNLTPTPGEGSRPVRGAKQTTMSETALGDGGIAGMPPVTPASETPVGKNRYGQMMNRILRRKKKLSKKALQVSTVKHILIPMA